jgi:hypothetical protein
MKNNEPIEEGNGELWRINPVQRVGRKTPSYYDWTLADWTSFYMADYRSMKTNIPEITIRCHNKKTDSYNAYIIPSQYEFSFMGYAFVSHPNPDRESDWENETPGGDYHISEAISGFQVSFGSSRDSARASARMILIKNAGGLHAALNRAMQTIAKHKWTTKYFDDGKGNN